ncbi:MAG: hypothetical protein R3C44_07990 [Chloroflexota bacterium]
MMKPSAAIEPGDFPVSQSHQDIDDLIRQAFDLYDEYELDQLPAALKRNSLDYYYLSIYPALSEMRPFSVDNRPPYPETVGNLYVHIPFCSGVCEFCSYYLVAINPANRERIARYLDLVRRELDYHASRTKLDITYLYFGGGTPSLIPPDMLDEFLGYLDDREWLNPTVLGTLELHPELFANRRANDLLDVLHTYGLTRVMWDIRCRMSNSCRRQSDDIMPTLFRGLWTCCVTGDFTSIWT